MRRYAKDPIREAQIEGAKEAETISAIDLVDQLEKCKLILQREIQNLLKLSLEGKLKSRESETLTMYTNLIAKLVKEEEKQAESKS